MLSEKVCVCVEETVGVLVIDRVNENVFVVTNDDVIVDVWLKE